ncbi:hypothetical protein IPL68_03195 [Candidatus Saccharibacteria bacterium]|nr:MAG: hypothetical protein IPL68_03195 [Candidatus Saccharibacteria bacterium]
MYRAVKREAGVHYHVLLIALATLTVALVGCEVAYRNIPQNQWKQI